MSKSIILGSLLITLFFVPSLSYAIDGCSSDGCYAYSWSVASAAGATQLYPLELSFEGCVLKSPYGTRINSVWPATIDAAYVTLRTWKWVNGFWSSVEGRTAYKTTLEVANQLQDIMEGKGVPSGVEPSEYWPDGPPNGCSDDPCYSEKQAMATECSDQSMVDYTNWNEDTCSGAVCRVCPVGQDDVNGECVPECSVNQVRDASGVCQDLGTCSGDSYDQLSEQCYNNCESYGQETNFTCTPVIGGFETSCECLEISGSPYAPDKIPGLGESGTGGYGTGDNGNGLDLTLEPDTGDDSATEPQGQAANDPADSPPDDPVGEDAKWLKPIKENTDAIASGMKQLLSNSKVNNRNDLTAIKQRNEIKQGIAIITQNQVNHSKQLGAIATNTASTVEGLQHVVSELKNLDDLEVKGTITLQDTNIQIPDGPIYDSTVDYESPDGEEDLFTVVGSYISENVPILNYIQGSDLSVSGSVSSLSTSIYGKQVECDLTPYQSLFNKAGLVLVFVSSVISFQIVVSRVS